MIHDDRYGGMRLDSGRMVAGWYGTLCRDNPINLRAGTPNRSYADANERDPI